MCEQDSPKLPKTAPKKSPAALVDCFFWIGSSALLPVALPPIVIVVGASRIAARQVTVPRPARNAHRSACTSKMGTCSSTHYASAAKFVQKKTWTSRFQSAADAMLTMEEKDAGEEAVSNSGAPTLDMIRNICDQGHANDSSASLTSSEASIIMIDTAKAKDKWHSLTMHRRQSTGEDSFAAKRRLSSFREELAFRTPDYYSEPQRSMAANGASTQTTSAQPPAIAPLPFAEAGSRSTPAHHRVPHLTST